MFHAVGKSDPGQQFLRARLALQAGATARAEARREHDILQRREARHKVERLEDETDVFTAKMGKLGVRAARECLVAIEDLPARGGIERTQQMKESGLA
jgi:hypothetical protein